MQSRRRFIKNSASMIGGPALSNKSLTASQITAETALSMPEENDTHETTWMAFVAND